MRTLLVAVLLAVASCAAPSDVTMIRRFEDKRPIFEQLVQMCYEDQTAADNGVRSAFINIDENDSYESTVDEARLAEYRPRFQEVRPLQFIQCTDDEVEFQVHSAGFSVSGSTKSYIYKPRDTELRVIASLDDHGKIWQGQSGFAIAYRDIGDGWYLRYIGT